MIDPLFKQMTQKFDDMSLSNLMSSRLSVNNELIIQLDSSMPQSSSDFLASDDQRPVYAGLVPGPVDSLPTAPFSLDLEEYMMVQHDFINELLHHKPQAQQRDLSFESPERPPQAPQMFGQEPEEVYHEAPEASYFPEPETH